MKYTTHFIAYGHPNITAKHKTTLMFTKENYLSSRGDCIVGIKASKGLLELNDSIKMAVRSGNTRILLSLKIGNETFVTSGKGHPKLTYIHPTDMVVRRSNYVCDRTLMVDANRAASDISYEIISLLKDKDQEIMATLTFECDTE